MATLTRIASPEDDVGVVGVTLLKDLKQNIQSGSRMGRVSFSQMKYQELGCNETSASLNHDGGDGIAMLHVASCGPEAQNSQDPSLYCSTSYSFTQSLTQLHLIASSRLYINCNAMQLGLCASPIILTAANGGTRLSPSPVLNEAYEASNTCAALPRALQHVTDLPNFALAKQQTRSARSTPQMLSPATLTSFPM